MEPTGAAHLWRANGHLRLDQFQDALEHYGIALRLYGDQHSASVRIIVLFNFTSSVWLRLHLCFAHLLPFQAGVKEAMRYAAECKLQPSKEAKKVQCL